MHKTDYLYTILIQTYIRFYDKTDYFSVSGSIINYLYIEQWPVWVQSLNIRPKSYAEES